MGQTYRTIYCYIFLLIPSINLAQNENNIWYFGHKAGIDFNSGSPVALSNSAMSTLEGCSSICDAQGNLLFYTDGDSVWNRNHVVMPNGFNLLGHWSSAQSALIVKKPGSNLIYYIFTTASSDYFSPVGFNYSEVDMSLQGGLGDVTSNKNIGIIPNVREKVTAIQHSNCRDIWIVTRIQSTNIFHSYLLTSSGLNFTPIVSHQGSSIMGSWGFLKSSPDGKKIAESDLLGFNRGIQLFDFDNSTGVLSNAFFFSTSGSYGIEFSPNSQVLYSSESFEGNLSQYNLSLNSQFAIDTSKLIIIPDPPIMLGGLQLAPDGKIYVSRPGESKIGIIHNPDSIGINCTYTPEGFDLLNRQCRGGLPNTFVGYHNAFSYENLCLGDSTIFTPSCLVFDSLVWNFDDPITGINNISRDTFPIHIFSDTGSFDITLIRFLDGFPDTIINTLRIDSPIHHLNLGKDTLLCEGPLLLNPNKSNVDFLWDDGSTDSTLWVHTNGEYWVQLSNACGSVSDSINILFDFPIDLGNDTILCNGTSLLIDASTSRATSYLWQDGSTDSTFFTTIPGTYWVEVTTNHCISSDTVEVFYVPSPTLNLGNDTTLCSGESLILNSSSPHATYLWHNGSTDSIFDLSTQGNFWGTYRVDVTTPCGVFSDTIIINNFIPPSVFMEADTFLCVGDSITLWPNIFGANSHMWQDGSTDFSFTASEPGSYWVQATNECGNGSDTTNINFLTVDLGNDTTLCLGDTVNLDASFPGATYLWQDGSTNPTFTVSSPGIFWVQVTRSCGSVTDTIEVAYHPYVNVHLGNDTTLCPGVDLTLDASFSGATYLWQDGSTDSTLTATGSGMYWVTVSNSCESATDTIEIFNHLMPTIDLGNDTSLCQGEALTLDATTSNASYLWQDNSTGPTFNVSTQGNYWVQVTTECFLVTDSIDVLYYPLLTLNLGNDTLLCPLETLVLDASNPGVSYLWQDNSTSSTFLVNGAGTYWVEVSDNCSSLSDSINITYEDPLTIYLGNDTNLCQGETLALNATSPNASYLWQDNSTNSSFSVLQQGTYWVQVSNNCETEADTIMVNFHSLPAVNLGSDTLLCPEETISLFTTIPNADYLWQDNSNDSLFLVTEGGTYWVQVTVPACGSTSDTVIVRYDPCEVVLIMPNVFSPNGDGDNDLFIPIKTEGINQADISIFNRWGQKIHESIEVIPGWDGTTTSGNIAPAGTYYWIVNYTNTNNEKAVLKGTLTLLR